MAPEPLHLAENAFSAGGEIIGPRCTDFGVHDRRGRLLPHGRAVGFPWRTEPPAWRRRPRGGPVFAGTVLFAGCHDGAFGHDLMGALGRLWALDHLPEQTVVAYTSLFPRTPFVHRLIRALGYRNPVVTDLREARFERLATAEERFGMERGGRGTPEFHAWIDSRWPPAGNPDPGRWLYVSRVGLGPGVGRFACEEHLEALLAAAGYEIYRPEAHDILHQVRTYQSASRLIFAEGSAVHLFSLVRRPGQRSALIQRRRELPPLIEAHMADRPGAPTVAIDVITAELWPEMRQANCSLATLDFDRLRARLVELGLIDAGCAWRSPDEEEVRASLQAGLRPGGRLLTPEERVLWLQELRRRRRLRRARARDGQQARART